MEGQREAVQLTALTEGLVSSHRLQVRFPQCPFPHNPPTVSRGQFCSQHLFLMPPLFLTSSQSLIYVLFCRLFDSKVTINRGHYCKRKGDSLQPQTEAMQAEALYIHFNVIAHEVRFLHFWSGYPQFREGTKL